MPTLGDMPVADITVADVVKCLTPIWKTKTDTAAKIRQRVEAIIDNAISLGDREKHNPASRSGANESEDWTKCVYFSAIRNWIIVVN